MPRLGAVLSARIRPLVRPVSLLVPPLRMTGETAINSPLRRPSFSADLGGIIVDQRAGDRPRGEPVGADFGNRRHLGAGAADKAFLEAVEFVRHDAPLDQLDAAPAREVDHRAPRDAVEEAVGDRRMQHASAGRKYSPPYIRRRGPASRASSRRRSRPARRGAWRWCRSYRGRRPWRGPARSADRAAGIRRCRAGCLSFSARCRTCSASPRPRWRREWWVLRRDGHHLAAAPGDRTDIAILEIIPLDDLMLMASSSATE